MKTLHKPRSIAVALMALFAALAAFVLSSSAQSYTNGLIAYWPLDNVKSNAGPTFTTPDVINGYDLTLQNSTGTNLFPARATGATNAMRFLNAPSQLARYVAGPTDLLPVLNDPSYTINMWMNVQGQNGGGQTNSYGGAGSPNDTRWFGISDFNGASSPLWVIGNQNGGGDQKAHWLLRQDSGGGTINPYILANGYQELPNIQRVQGELFTRSNICDGFWHMLTITKHTNAAYTVFVDGQVDPGGSTLLDADGNPTVLPTGFLTNVFTNDLFVGQPWVWEVKATAIGGIARNIPGSSYCNGFLDDVGMWNRDLTTNEVGDLYTNTLTSGITGVANPNILIITTFSGDFTNSAVGGPTTLRWVVSGNNSLSVNQGVGNVFGQQSVTTTTPNASSVTYTLTAGNGIINKTATVTVFPFSGISSEWSIIDRLDELAAGSSGISGGNWINARSDFGGAMDLFNVVSVANQGGVNKVLAPRYGYFSQNPTPPPYYTPRGCLTAIPLNSLSIKPGQSNTLFFRFVLNKLGNEQPGLGLTNDNDFTDIGLSVSLTEKTINSPAFFPFDVGPCLRIIRALNSGVYPPQGGPFNLAARSGTNGFLANFSYTNTVPDGLQTNAIYNCWIDVQNNAEALDVNGDTTNMDTFSIWIQKQGDVGRTLVVSNFLSDRDTFNPASAVSSPDLNEIAISVQQGNLDLVTGVSYQGTNTVAMDDFFMSRSGYSSTIPRLFDIRTVSRVGNNATVTWDSLAPMSSHPNATVTYTVQKKNAVTDVSWITLTNGLPSGGYTTSYTDTTASGNVAFYRITAP